ncbi:PDZ domain-containing protein [Terrilactibacillus laevilacticus]|uniref:PDZ domain-containing protein n=1 Tax=Terrilactibacillus laevilacticus TaxID=1380157 RepID=A0ABW5PLL9_9BACI|nr:PDZ domain-containing protein [Terrilactibacillus laevilacticus]
MDVIISIIKGIVSLLINPIFYLLLIGLVAFGVQRVRRERRSFGLKVYGMFNTIFSSIGASLVIALLSAIFFLGLHIRLTPGMLVLMSCTYLLIMLTRQLRFLSPSIGIGLAIVIAYVLPDVNTPYLFLNQWIQDIRTTSLPDFGLFFLFSLAIEWLLVMIRGDEHTSPRLINSHRGKKVGAHEASHMWIVPLIFFIPMSQSHATFHFWPFVPGESFGLLIFPLGIGYQQLISDRLPRQAIQSSSAWLFLTGLLCGISVILANIFHLPILVAIAGLLSFVSRLGLILVHHLLHRYGSYYFTEPSDGLRVVDVIPHSLADRMDVQIGEIIYRVNGKDVHSEYAFYQALQINSAYCKLEVIDQTGESRFVKGAIHEKDDHKIGFLFLEPNKRKQYMDQKEKSQSPANA